jgi:hypothetical protein
VALDDHGTNLLKGVGFGWRSFFCGSGGGATVQQLAAVLPWVSGP